VIFRIMFWCEISYESVYCGCDYNNRKRFILIYLPFDGRGSFSELGN